MNVFISWSGNQSKRMGGQIKDSLYRIFHNSIQLFYSPDISAGRDWFNTISTALNETSFGIFCFNKENLNNRWLLFELGAVSKGDTRNNTTIPLLIDLTYKDIEDPIRMFNCVPCDEEGLKRIAFAINEKLDDDKMEKSFLEDRVKTEWKKSKKKFTNIIDQKDDIIPIKFNPEIMKRVISEKNINNVDIQFEKAIEGRNIIEYTIKERFTDDLNEFVMLVHLFPEPTNLQAFWDEDYRLSIKAKVSDNIKCLRVEIKDHAANNFQIEKDYFSEDGNIEYNIPLRYYARDNLKSIKEICISVCNNSYKELGKSKIEIVSIDLIK